MLNISNKFAIQFEAILDRKRIDYSIFDITKEYTTYEFPIIEGEHQSMEIAKGFD